VLRSVSGGGLHQGLLIAGSQIGNRGTHIAQVVVEFVEIGVYGTIDY